MNQFDRFIEETDRQFNIDTSSRKTSIELVNGTEEGKRRDSDNSIEVIDDTHSSYSDLDTQSKSGIPVIPNSESSRSNNSKSIIPQRPLTPVRINNLSDQPLNDVESENYKKNEIVQNDAFTNTSQFNGQNSQGSRDRSSSKSVINKRKSLIQPLIIHNDHRHKKDVSSGSIDTNHSFQKNMEKTVNNESSTTSSFDSNTSNNFNENSYSSTSLVDSNDVDELLKKLANKELELLESKRKIEELKKKLIYHEELYEKQYNDLKKLKEKVSKHLSYKSPMKNDASRNSTMKEPQSQEEIAQSTPKKISPIIKEKLDYVNINKRGQSTSPLGMKNHNNTKINLQREKIRNNPSDMTNESHSAVTKLNPIDYNPPKKPQSRNESMWSKPFTLFNQFDQLLQNELEKSLNWNNETENESSFTEEVDKNKHDDIIRSDYDNPDIPNTNDHLRNRPTIDKRHLQPSNQSLTRSVSTSLWGFVNDMKEGLLGTYDIIDEGKSRSQDSITMKEFNTVKENDQIDRSVEMSYI